MIFTIPRNFWINAPFYELPMNFFAARNFDESGKAHDGINIHSDDNNGKDAHKPQSSQLRKNSGIRITDCIVEDEEEEDTKTKNLAKYLGMKDGVSTSIASQVDAYFFLN